MKRRSLIITGLVVCAVVVAVYGALRQDPASSRPVTTASPGAGGDGGGAAAYKKAHLPPAGAPLAQTFQPLSKAAASGDPAARVRVFSDVATCLGRGARDANLARLARDKNWIVNNPNFYQRNGTVDAQARDQALASVEENIKRVESSTEMCAGAPDVDDGRVYQFALLAAQSGDATAASCLLMAPYNGPDLTNEEASRFGEQARSAAEAAVPSGSWGLINALRFAYGGTGLPGMGSFVDIADPAKKYRYTRLMRYGYPDGSPDANQVDLELAALADRVPSEARASSDEWASKMFKDHYFLNGPAIPNEPSCPY